MQKLNDLSRCLTPLEPDSTLTHAWIASSMHPARERMPWCACWRV
jgi:hypothetical protein